LAVEASERLVARPRDEKLANTATEDVIVVERLGVRYAAEAVAGIDLNVARGEIFASSARTGRAKGRPSSFDSPAEAERAAL